MSNRHHDDSFTKVHGNDLFVSGNVRQDLEKHLIFLNTSVGDASGLFVKLRSLYCREQAVIRQNEDPVNNKSPTVSEFLERVFDNNLEKIHNYIFLLCPDRRVKAEKAGKASYYMLKWANEQDQKKLKEKMKELVRNVYQQKKKDPSLESLNEEEQNTLNGGMPEVAELPVDIPIQRAPSFKRPRRGDEEDNDDNTNRWPYSEDHHEKLRYKILTSKTPSCLANIYSRDDIQHMIRQVTFGMNAVEESEILAWCQNFAVDQSKGAAWTFPYNQARKTILLLLEKLYYLHIEERVPMDDLMKHFTVDRIAQILIIFLPMDRYKCLFEMKPNRLVPGPPTSDNHFNWYSGDKQDPAQYEECKRRGVPFNVNKRGLLSKCYLRLYQFGKKYSLDTKGVEMGSPQSTFLQRLFVPTAWENREDGLPQVDWAPQSLKADAPMAGENSKSNEGSTYEEPCDMGQQRGTVNAYAFKDTSKASLTELEQDPDLLCKYVLEQDPDLLCKYVLE